MQNTLSKLKQGVLYTQITPLMPRSYPILTHEPLNSFLGSSKITQPQFTQHSRPAIGALDLGMNGPYDSQCLRIGQAFRSAVPPRFHAR